MMQAKAVGTAILVALIFVAGWVARGWKEGASREAEVRAKQEAYEAAAAYMNDVAKRVEENQLKLRVTHERVVHEREKIISRPEYRDVCLDDAGLSLVRDALTDSGKPADSVPGDDAAR